MTIKSDLRIIRLPLLTAATLMVLGCALAVYAWHRFDTAERNYNAVFDRARNTANQVRLLREKLSAAIEFNQRFSALSEKGAVGQFRKTHEIDRFETIMAEQAVRISQYKLGGRLPVTDQNSSGLAEFELNRYELSFQTTPLHEERFADMLDDLNRRLGGLHTIDSCELARADQTRLKSVGSKNMPLNASCSLSWYVFAPRQQDTTIGGTAPEPTMDEF